MNMTWKKPKTKTKQENDTEFYDISWLMDKVDPVFVLEKLGVRIHKIQGDQIIGWCPDHHLFVKRESSHPKWAINIKTGQTNCFTEGRGSNLLWITCRMRRCSAKNAIEWMLGKENDIDNAIIDKMQREFNKIQDYKKKTEKKIEYKEAEKWIKEERMLQDGYDYFMYPIDKKPTLINKETVDKYKCVQLTRGRYKDRVIIPFFVNEKLVGYEAVEIYGKKNWIKNHPGLSDESYRKVLYPSGLKKKKILFGIDIFQFASYVMLVEGARDAMKLNQLGYNACAILGSDISEEQIMLLADKNPSYVYLFFDGDDAGIRATEKCKKKLEEFFNVIPIITPENHDPKDLQNEAIKELIKNAKKKLTNKES